MHSQRPSPRSAKGDALAPDSGPSSLNSLTLSSSVWVGGKMQVSKEAAVICPGAPQLPLPTCQFLASECRAIPLATLVAMVSFLTGIPAPLLSFSPPQSWVRGILCAATARNHGNKEPSLHLSFVERAGVQEAFGRERLGRGGVSRARAVIVMKRKLPDF